MPDSVGLCGIECIRRNRQTWQNVDWLVMIKDEPHHANEQESIWVDSVRWNKKLIKRWDSEHEFSLRRHRTRTTKYNRLIHTFRHSSTWICVGTHVYQIQWNNAMQRPLRRSRSFNVTDFGTDRKFVYDFLSMINTNLPPITVSKLWLIISQIFR